MNSFSSTKQNKSKINYDILKVALVWALVGFLFMRILYLF
jgi:hypothetical protein